MTKLIFANQLRGLAALLVVATHYLGIYFGAPQVVSAITFSPNLHLVAPAWTGLLDVGYFRGGPLGVALFFLISGLVISFSLEKTEAPAFLANRFFRIVPTYILTLALGLLMVWLSARYWSIPFGYKVWAIVSNALLVNNLFDIPSIDAVNWTLAIEIKFYLLLALGRPILLRKPCTTIAVFSLVVLFLTQSFVLLSPGADLATIQASNPFAGAFLKLLVELNYIVFMLIGVLFYRYVGGYLGLISFLAISVPILLVFGFNWLSGPQKDQFFIVPLNYLFAYGTFLVCCAARKFFRPVRILDFFASISFPLYLIHSLLGYILLKIAMARGLSYGGALGGTIVVVILVAYLLHRMIEMPSSALGKRMCAQWFATRQDKPNTLGLDLPQHNTFMQ